MTVKAFAVRVVVALAILAAGWVWGASGKAAVDQARRATETQLHYARARAGILDGRLTLVGNDYANAAALFAQAQTELETLQRMLREVGRAELGGQVEIVLSHVRRARDAAAAGNANAWTAADAALQALKGIVLPE
jgi:hypothetical protein